MKKILFSNVTALILILFLMSFLNPAILMAHPPSSLIVNYDPETEILDVVAKHSVKNPQNHFVDKFRVFVDSKRMFELEISVQFSDTKAMGIFYLPALQKGSKITVEAECNKFGSRKKTLTVN